MAMATKKRKAMRMGARAGEPPLCRRQLLWLHCPLRCGRLEQAAPGEQQEGEEKTGCADRDDGGFPAGHAVDADHDRRGDGEAEIAAEGVDGKGPPGARAAHPPGEDGIVGRVIDGVADAADDHGEQQCAIARQDADQDEGQSGKGLSECQDERRAEAVDGESHGRLKGGGDQVEDGDGDAELGRRIAEFGRKNGKERRQGEDVEMRKEVGDGDEADDLDIRTAAAAHRLCQHGPGGEMPRLAAFFASLSMMPG
ncbi:MAG: hypothetical protein R3C97_16275 [Geminicoccaceae bacterium]